MAHPDVKVDLSSLLRLKVAVADGMRKGSAARGHVNAAFRQWAERYRGFAQERFDAFSKGGGNWKRLSNATLASRGRKGKAGKRYNRKRRRYRIGAKSVLAMPAILVDTGILKGALQTKFRRKPGQLQKSIPYGVRVGYGGPGKHPGGKSTISDIAEHHQKGGGRLPKREIIVDPPKRVTDMMARDMERALQRVIDGR